MTSEKSKRQLRREQMQREQTRSRLLWIGLITIGALAITAIIISMQSKPQDAPTSEVGDFVTVEPNPRPNAEGKSMGDPNAPVKIDVFEDFQCPACRNFTQTVEPLIVTTYVATGKVYYVFHQYPFLDTFDNNPLTAESHQAASASMCAMEQGKFWEYHDMLFANWNGENEGAFSDSRLVAFAKAINLDLDSFNACFKDDKFSDAIQADLDLGNQMGVSGTPSVFVNGKIVSPGYAPQFADIQTMVEEILTGK